jgi:hypothetical protein
MFPRKVYGKLIDRYLFNFRVSPEALQSKLPTIEWLKPRLVNGYGVVSFCLLYLEDVTIWPLPSTLGVNSTSCAYRCGAVDNSHGLAEPSVYVFGRYTNLPLISRLGTILFSGPMRLIYSSIHDHESSTEIQIRYQNGKPLFDAYARPIEKPGVKSRLFETTEDFVSFIKGGMSSYTPSNKAHQYSRVDLVEDSNYYEPVTARIDYNLLDHIWPDTKSSFDSAFHATGGRYALSYLGSAHQFN